MVVKCAGCDEVLYSGPEIIEPREVIERFDGKCPACRRKLSLHPESYEIKPYIEGEGV